MVVLYVYFTKETFYWIICRMFQRFYFYELYHVHKIGQIVSKKEKEIFNTIINLNAWYNNDAEIDLFLERC